MSSRILIQLGGGTDINKSVAYGQQFVTDTSKTLFILISDLYEGETRLACIPTLLPELLEGALKEKDLNELATRLNPGRNENRPMPLFLKNSNYGGCFRLLYVHNTTHISSAMIIFLDLQEIGNQ